jgi:hypothetical protein
MKKKKCLGCVAFTGIILAGTISLSHAAIIDFTGGTAYLSDGSSVVTDNIARHDNVDYYVEDGVKVDFIGGVGFVGDYYSMGQGGFVGNSVLHAHWPDLSSIVFTKVDGASFDLNYFDLSSNTTIGGGQQTGTELSYITSSNGSQMLLPSSDWGFGTDYVGAPGDGIERLWLSSSFDNILSFTVTSRNAYCFGLDNFYINEQAPNPTPTPEPATMLLMGTGIAGLIAGRRKKKA